MGKFNAYEAYEQSPSKFNLRARVYVCVSYGRTYESHCTRFGLLLLTFARSCLYLNHIKQQQQQQDSQSICLRY